MTFADWRARYPSVSVEQSTEDPAVYLVSGVLASGPRQDLDALSDYVVSTSVANTVWVAPRDYRGDYNRDDYMSGRISFDTYYRAVADAIGRDAIDRLALSIAPASKFAELGSDLNKIPLARWDRLHASVQALVRPSVMAVSWSRRGVPVPFGKICWSLSESVCVLKAAARRLGEEWNAAK